MPMEIATQLGVRGVARGELQLEDDVIRLRIELLDATNGELLLEEEHERPTSELSSLQTLIAGSIARALSDPARLPQPPELDYATVI